MRIAKLDLNQLNKQLDVLNSLVNRVSALEQTMSFVQFQSAQTDFVHARPTFNNMTFTWTGGTSTLSWTKGWVKDKNAAIDTGKAYSQAPSFKSNSGVSASVTHNIGVHAGSIASLSASTYYWLGWDTTNEKMYAEVDITQLYSHHDMQVICQLFTGTAGQTGTAGGGGSQGGSDLSGARYKLF